ncbi:hypothetical protein Z043_119891 [Scleropages formosus]|uniref:Uncharacterized protein n=1 Tax=Scleropages formosus TaxID=113540 RepID=A0A0P7TW46_SCLFO|nr:hypothetical protein Z043_119891 [Scleropages formosus]
MGQVHREALYGGREGQHSLRQPPLGSPAHGMASPLSPPPPLSMPPSPSRIPFGPRGATLPGGATLPRDRLASVPAGRAASPCPSAILERRDVKPDEDMGPAGVGVALARGDALYSDSYLLHEGRLSIASSHSGHPPDVVDHLGMSAYHRSPLRSPAGPYAGPESPEHHALYRQKSRKYSEKTPPPSPHRMVEVHASQGTHLPPQGAPLERASPVRQSFHKEGMETLVKARGGMASPVTPDLPPGSPNDPQTRERMKAMEAQIASLTGLVKHALLKGPGAAEAKENSSRNTYSTSEKFECICWKTSRPGPKTGLLRSGNRSYGSAELMTFTKSKVISTSMAILQRQAIPSELLLAGQSFVLHQNTNLKHTWNSAGSRPREPAAWFPRQAGEGRISGPQRKQWRQFVQQRVTTRRSYPESIDARLERGRHRCRQYRSEQAQCRGPLRQDNLAPILCV